MKSKKMPKTGMMVVDVIPVHRYRHQAIFPN
jgi:hypothetical protein